MEEYKEGKETPAHEKKEEQSEQQIVARILKLKNSYEQATVDSRNEYSEVFNVYMGKTENVQSTPYDTKDDIPKLRTEISYIKPFIYSGDPVVEIEGIGDEDKAISKIYEKIINHRFNTIPKFKDKIESWVGQGVAFNASEIKVLWRFQTIKNEDGSETPVVDEPDVEVPNHMDVYFNPIISEVKDQPCMIFRSVLPLDDVKKNEAYTYVNKEGVRNVETLEATGSQPINPYDSSNLLNTDIPNAQQKATAGMVEIFELVDNERIQTIAGDKVLRDVENPYGFKNVVKFVFEPNVIPNRYEGFGVGLNTLGLGKMSYKLFNQLATNVKLCNNPMSVGVKGSVPDKRQLVSKPGGHVELDAKGKSLNEVFQWLQFPDIKQGAIEILNKVDDEHKRASGASDLIQGAASNDTLGQDEIVQANVSNRFELIVRRFKDALAEVADMMLKMELQNLQSPDASILRIFPQELRPQIYELLINEKDNVKYNVKIKGETNVTRNKALESKRLVEMFNLSQNFLTDKEKRAFLRRIAEKQGEDNIDEIIGESNPIMEQQEQMALQQGQMGMQGGMTGEMPDQQMMGDGMQDNLAQQANG